MKGCKMWTCKVYKNTFLSNVLTTRLILFRIRNTHKTSEHKKRVSDNNNCKYYHLETAAFPMLLAECYNMELGF